MEYSFPRLRDAISHRVIVLGTSVGAGVSGNIAVVDDSVTGVGIGFGFGAAVAGVSSSI